MPPARYSDSVGGGVLKSCRNCRHVYSLLCNCLDYSKYKQITMQLTIAAGQLFDCPGLASSRLAYPKIETHTCSCLTRPELDRCMQNQRQPWYLDKPAPAATSATSAGY